MEHSKIVTVGSYGYLLDETLLDLSLAELNSAESKVVGCIQVVVDVEEMEE